MTTPVILQCLATWLKRQKLLLSLQTSTVGLQLHSQVYEQILTLIMRIQIWLIIIFIWGCNSQTNNSDTFVSWVDEELSINLKKEIDNIIREVDLDSDLFIYVDTRRNIKTNLGSNIPIDTLIEQTVRAKRLVILIPNTDFSNQSLEPIYDIYGSTITAMRKVRNENSQRSFGKDYADLKYPDRRKVSIGGVPFFIFSPHLTSKEANSITDRLFDTEILFQKKLILED